MNCRGVSRRLSVYIDDELSPGIKESVRDHLSSCPACNKKLSDLKAISGAARSLPPLHMPKGFKEQVLESARVEKGRAIIVSGFRMKAALSGFAFAAAAAAVFLLAGPKAPTVTPEPRAPDFTAEAGNPASEPSKSVDFTEDPTIKIESFPIPEGARVIDFAGNDSFMLADSVSKVKDYILPVIEKTKENVNIRF